MPTHRSTEVRSSRVTLYAALAAVALCIGVGPASATPVDGFEGGLPSGATGTGIVLGFSTFAGTGTVSISTTTASPAGSVPGAATGNAVLQMDVNTDSFAGFARVFESAGALAPQDWSSYGAMTLWLYGNNTGKAMYIDVLDNADGTGNYPFEIWTSVFTDNFNGWKQLSFAFAGLTRKDIGNGAPSDGLGLTAVHGWALGVESGSNGPRTYYVDDVRLAVPEPGTLALLGVGLFMMMGIASRRRH